MKKLKLAVIGNGMAGARLVEDLLARDGRERLEIVVFGDEPYGNYNRILLSDVLAGRRESRDIFLNPLGWYIENEIRLHAGARVTDVDLEQGVLTAQGGLRERYDRLVFATGSSPFLPPLKNLRAAAGALKPGAFALRTLDDCSAIAAWAVGAKRAAVIGGGLLGLEAARGLLGLGLEVHVVHLMPSLMELQLDAQGGAILKRTMEQMGLRIHLGKNTTEVLGEEAVRGLRFEDGASLECELLVISAGIRPNVDLARKAGLLVERGIVVGDDLRAAGQRDVYALGECAQHRGRTYGLVEPLWEQAQVLAERLSGRMPMALYRGSRISTKLRAMGVELTVMGLREAADERDEEVLFVDGARGIYKKMVVRDGGLVGAILLGDNAQGPSLLQAFDRATPLPENRSELLIRPSGQAGAPGVLGLPEVARICSCNGVAKGRIVQAIQSGCRTLEALGDATRAGTACGGCRESVAALLEASAPEGAPEDPGAPVYAP